MTPSDQSVLIEERILEWTRERERLFEMLDEKPGGFPRSPEALADLRRDIAECNSTIRRFERMRGRSQEEVVSNMEMDRQAARDGYNPNR